ncbi:hypothetical protein LGH70_22920 [Hymenobacter sp. BT635]|uniref:DUF4468 domain-containing protein n=1 Tax=Hymenobacter nitidus TaxID=2880929 RepID=A0ABS8ALS3_9BACT|nr:hypothetical protein [Hymenobacter nitidus]MCB2380464.1 hypothetical protein [Hymenobacter nitidus]
MNPTLPVLVTVLSLSGTLALLPHAACAQAKVGVIPQKGYIVTLAGDTVQGYILPAPATRASTACDFMLPRQVEVKHYLAGELRGYGTAAITCESHQVPSVTGKLPRSMVPVFLAVVTRGPLTLFHLSTGETPRYFLGGYRLGKVVELEIRTEKIYRNSQTFLVRMPLYQDTLARAFRSCPGEAKRVSQYSLQTKELKRAVERFNFCGKP